MILTNQEIKEILLTRPTKQIWEQAAEASAKLQMHVLGNGLQRHISIIEGYESQKGESVRRKYGKSNRDLFARVLRPIDNIWNGRGGGKVFLTTEANQKRIRSMVQDVYKNFSLQVWVEKFWRPRYIDDPMGIIFMEVNIRQKNGTYPTYKSSSDIFEALPNGRRLEWVFFKTPDPEVYRLVDDAKDILVKMTGTGDDARVTVLKGKEYPQYVNWFYQVPALIVSDLPKDGDEVFFQSPVTDEIELADQFLRDGSIANIYRFKNGFPLTWKYPEVCGTCKGQKNVGGNPCPDCNASGIKLKSSPGDISVFAWPTKDEPEIRDKGGFISPALEYLKYADENLAGLEDLIYRTHWGTDREKQKQTGEEKTATGRFLDTQPVVNRLTAYAKAAETVEEFIVNHIGEYNFKTGWQGCSINLGRRFLIEKPDEIWKKYEDGRKNGAPINALNDLLRDYYETKYQANETELQKALVLMKLEPGVHLTMKEAKEQLPWIEYIKKVYFSEYISTLTDIEIATRGIDKLRQGLQDYAVKKVETDPTDPNAKEIDPNTEKPIVKTEPATV